MAKSLASDRLWPTNRPTGPNNLLEVKELITVVVHFVELRYLKFGLKTWRVPMEEENLFTYELDGRRHLS